MDLLDRLWHHADRTPGAPLLVTTVEGELVEHGYGAVRDRLTRLAAGFAARGVAPGDRVGIAVYSGTLGVELYLAAQLAGVHPVLLPWAAATRLDDLVAQFQLVEIAVDDAFAARLDVLPSGARSVHEGWEATAGPRDAPHRPEGAMSAIQFSTGTTGNPKPMVRTVGCDYDDAVNWCGAMGVGPAERWVAPSPLNINVALGALRRMVLHGGAVLLMDGYSHEELDAVTRGGVTILPLMAAGWRNLLASDLGPVLVDRGLRTAIATGARTPAATLSGIRELVGGRGRVVNLYGLTEASTVATWSSAWGVPAPTGTVGRLAPLVQVELREPLEVPPADAEGAGEIVVRSTASSPGYATPDSPWMSNPLHVGTDGPAWLATGDVGRWAPDGQLQVLGRWRDALVVDGRYVHPFVLESRLGDLPGVEDVVVLPDPDGGLAVVLNRAAGDTGPAVRAALPEWPDVRVVVVERVPRGTSDKVDRAATAALLERTSR